MFSPSTILGGSIPRICEKWEVESVLCLRGSEGVMILINISLNTTRGEMISSFLSTCPFRASNLSITRFAREIFALVKIFVWSHFVGKLTIWLYFLMQVEKMQAPETIVAGSFAKTHLFPWCCIISLHIFVKIDRNKLSPSSAGDQVQRGLCSTRSPVEDGVTTLIVSFIVVQGELLIRTSAILSHA